MPEVFKLGVERLIYKSRNFLAGKNVTSRIWNPSLEQSSLLSLTEIGQGVYYLDFNFTSKGTYFGVFYEEGEAVSFGIWRVVDIADTVRTSICLPTDPANSLGKLLLETKGLVSQVYKIETGRWRIVTNQLILYDEDGVTPLFVFNLKDKQGQPTDENVFERKPA